MASRRYNIQNDSHLQSKEAEFKRLATFLPAYQLELPYFPIHLAKSGFYFSREDTTAVCEGCEFKIDLSHPVLEPCFQNHHREDCEFLNVSEINQLSARDAIGTDSTPDDLDDDGIDIDSAPCNEDFTVNYSAAPDVESKQGSYAGSSQLAGEVAFPPNRSSDVEPPQRSKGAGLLDGTSHAMNDCNYVIEGATADIESETESGYSPSSPEGSIIDCEIYDGESYLVLNAVRSDGDCTKNPGHFGYFILENISPEQLPSPVRCPEMITILKSLGALTVKLSVSHTSKDRPSGYSYSGHESIHRVGTGFVFHHPGHEKDLLRQLLNEKQKSAKISGIKKLVPFMKKQKSGYLFVQTNRHVVFDNKEAAATTVEIAVGPERNPVKLKGKCVLFSKIYGQSDVLLICKCQDPNLLNRLKQTRQELLALAEKLPKKAKTAMLKKVFIVHHPHGNNKVVSYGDSVMVKYEAKKEKNINGNQLVKLTGQQPVPPNAKNVLKTLFYVADTCPGSSGAPVIKFKRGPLDADGQYRLLLDVWMHDGVDKYHKLNGSILKACTWEDLQPPTASEAEMTVDQEEDDDQESIGNQRVNSQSFKVLSAPSYPIYVSYKARLDSYERDWKYDHIHTPHTLALAGFFFAGYSDCVRCFQCGLGLRSWKAGDDINAEHKKNRSSCPYLLALLSSALSADVASPQSLSAPVELALNEEETLLRNENVKLREQVTCKVCFKAEVKELFLPCGELCACSDCSKLLTHCPSCKRQILATVTTYFS